MHLCERRASGQAGRTMTLPPSARQPGRLYSVARFARDQSPQRRRDSRRRSAGVLASPPIKRAANAPMARRSCANTRASCERAPRDLHSQRYEHGGVAH